MTAPVQWWGSFTIPHGSAGCWHVGPMTLWIQRLPGEWRLARLTEDHDDDRAHVERPAAVTDLLSMDEVMRFGVSDQSETITLTPVLADRPVVTSPVRPFYIPGGEEVTVYVGSPLWLRIEAGDELQRLIEFPIVRPSDTWFGPNTYTGELCYASRTACRLQVDDLPFRPHRAATAVLLKNRSDKPMLLERMKLPVEYLPLFYVDSGAFWTRDLTVSHVEGQELTPIQYGPKKPVHAGAATLVSPARDKSDDNFAARVFASLFMR